MTTGDDLRGLMRLWPHGVSILSVDVEGDRMGVTVSSLVSLSLEPPLVGVSIGKDASCYELLRSAGRLAISLLGAQQEELARRFAAGYPPIVHWQGVPTREGQVAPLIEGALGWIEATTRGGGGARLDRGHDACRGGRRRPHLLHRQRARDRARPVASGARLPREHLPQRVIEGCVLDRDGVLLQAQEGGDAVREVYGGDRVGRYDAEVQRAMMGMSAPEWSA